MPVATKKPAPRAVSLQVQPFEVRQSAIQGKGAFATQSIRKGQKIVEYAGERISNDEADDRYDESKMKRHHTFLFTLDSKTVVDGAVDGNDSIYINHSCEPNCEAVIDNKRIYIHALRRIQTGEELLYDYQYERTGEDDEELEKFYKCLCGSANCRGSIMKLDKKKPAKRTKVTKGKAAKKTKAKGAAKKAKSVSKKKTAKLAKRVVKTKAKGLKKAQSKTKTPVRAAKKGGTKTALAKRSGAKRGVKGKAGQRSARR